MDLKHYVATTRPVDIVKVTGQPDQYWYKSTINDPADVSAHFFRCGQYIDNAGTVDMPYFFAPGGEDNDYLIGPGGINPAQLISRGSSASMFSSLFSELERDRKDLLLFMFGYHNPMVKEFDHVQRIHADFIQYGTTNIGRILMLTWPSQGFGEYDKELGGSHGQPAKSPAGIGADVTVAGNALAIFIAKLRNYMDARYALPASGIYRPRIHFIVQSMANQVWNIAVESLIRNNLMQSVSNTFDNLMLTSPDIRDDIFQFSPAYFQSTNLSRQALVIYSMQDTILQAANIFHRVSGQSRLGLTGPFAPAAIPGNTKLLEVNQGHRSFHPVDYNHRYFEYHPAVINFYASVFNNNPLPKFNSIVAP